MRSPHHFNLNSLPESRERIATQRRGKRAAPDLVNTAEVAVIPLDLRTNVRIGVGAEHDRVAPAATGVTNNILARCVARRAVFVAPLVCPHALLLPRLSIRRRAYQRPEQQGGSG